jgi:hypothetical protein
MSKLNFTEKEIDELRECLELLRSIESVQFHNMNWLPGWAIRNPGKLNQEKRSLINRAIGIVGSSAKQNFT